MKNGVGAAQFLLAMFLALFAAPGMAAIFTVTNGLDGGPGSLRFAIAIAATAGDIIEFAPGVTVVTLTTAELLVDKSVEIRSTGAPVTIQRNPTSGAFRVFRLLRGGGPTPQNITLRNLIIRNGLVAGEGGGIYSGARVLMFDTVVDNNESTAGNGGGGFANEPGGELLAFGCTFSNNRAFFTGGGLLQINGGILYLYESLVKDNVSTRDGGGLTSQSSTTAADVFLRNTTFFGNTAPLGGSAILNNASGGGNANMVILHATIAGNPSTAPAVVNNSNTSTSTLSFSSTLFANNGGSNLVRSGVGSTNTSDGFNLSDDGTAGGLPSDQINTNPLLAPFANYGGPRFTFALLPGSPAINRGNTASPPATDNRGIGRTQLGVPDVGAYESRGFTLTPVSGNNQSTLINTAFTNPLVLSVAAAFPIEPVVGGRISFQVPGAGASATISGVPIDPGGSASATITANAIPGPYLVAGSANGATAPLLFSLTNTAPIISVGNASVVEGSSGGVNLVFTITATPAVTAATTIDFATADGSAESSNDYVSLMGQRTFNIGESVQLVTVAIVTDRRVEGLEDFSLTLSNPTAGASIGTATAIGSIVNDDVATITVNAPSALEGNAGTTPLAFVFSINNPVQGAVSFAYSSADGNDPNPLLNATLADSDYAAATGSVTFPGFSLATQTATINVNGDLEVEPNQALRLLLSGLSIPPGINPADIILTATTAFGTINNDDGTVVSISDAGRLEGNAGLSALSFSVDLSAPSKTAVTVSFATSDGSAIAGSDYVANSGTVTFVPGDISETVSVQINGDAVVEATQSFNVTLSAPVGATLGTASAIGTISNDDSAVISIDAPSVLEGSVGFIAPLAFTVSISQTVEGVVGFNFASADGNDPNPLLNATLADGDYSSTFGSSSFTNVISSRVFAVPVNGDADVEPDQQLRLLLSALTLPPGVNPADVTFAASSAIGTVLNDDGSIVSVGPASIAEATGTDTTLLFPVTLTAPSKTDVTVQFATNALSAGAGNDFIARTGTVTFSGQSVAEVVAVTIVGDDVVEANETLQLILSTPVGATLGTTTALGTVLDNDTATVSIANAVALEGNVGNTPLAFLVSLSNPVQGGVSATVNSADGNNINPLLNATVADNDYIAVVNGSVGLAAGSTVAVVQVIGDNEVEPDQFLSLGLSNLVLPVGVAPGAVTISTATAAGRINNDDTAGFSISNVSRAEGNSGTAMMTFTVLLSAPNKEPARVNFATSDGTAIAGSDYVAQTGVLNFAPGVLSQTVMIVINGDINFENDETFGLTLSNPLGANIVVGNAIGTIQNDDAPPVLTVEPVAVIEGNSGFSNALISVRRAGPTNLNANVTLTTAPLTATAPSDYQTTSTVLIFAPNELQKLVLVPVVGDTLAEADETFSVRLQSPINATVAAPGDATVTILNDDGEAVQFMLCGQRVEEGGTNLLARVSRAGTAALSVTWGLNPLTATPGQDYTPVSGVLQWLANDTQPKTISVPIIDDALVEPAEEFVIALGKVSPGAVLGAPNLLLARIEDNDDRLFGDGLEVAPCLPQ